MLTRQRTYTIQDRRRAMNLYATGHSVIEVESITGIPNATVLYWARCEGRVRHRSAALQIKTHGREWQTPENLAAMRRMLDDGHSRAAVAKRFGVSLAGVANVIRRFGWGAPKSFATMRRKNSPNRPAGARRLQMIRDIVTMRVDGVSLSEVAAIVGRSYESTRRMDHSPLADALRVFVHGTGGGGGVKIHHARAMYWRQGLPVWYIAKIIEASETTIERWIATTPTNERTDAPSAPQTRRKVAGASEGGRGAENAATVTETRNGDML